MPKDRFMPNKSTKIINPGADKQGPPKPKPGSGIGEYQAPRKPKPPEKK